MTRDKARIKACKLLQQAGELLLDIPDSESTTRIDFLVAEVVLCWKHVRDMDIGDQTKPPI